MQRIIVFGAGKYAEVMYHYFTEDSPYDIAAFTVDGAILDKKKHCGKPVVPFEEIANTHPPDDFQAFVAVGYQQLNALRTDKYQALKNQGYRCVTYRASSVKLWGDVPVGENCCILENQSIQPGCRIGNNVTLWCSNVIGHHASIDDNTYVSSHVTISGGASVGKSCFLGVNAAIGHAIEIGDRCFIGAGAKVTKSCAPESVFIEADTKKYGLPSDKFLQLTRMR